MVTRFVDDSGAVGRVVWRASKAVPGSAPADDAKAALEQQLRHAYEAGVSEGEANARKRFDDRARQLAAQSADAISQLAGIRGQALAGARSDVVRLSLEIARRVLHRELAADPDALSALVGAALEKLGTRDPYKVRAHPEQLPLIRRRLAEMHGPAGVELTPDPSLPEGGIVFESPQGSLDASLQTQLAEIERALAEHLS
jgi:flagellar biosynthesis/type III secretory pathway protein FliH